MSLDVDLLEQDLGKPNWLSEKADVPLAERHAKNRQAWIDKKRAKNKSAYQAKDSYAFDEASARSIDANGNLHVSKTHISKANVCEYMGHEIPENESLGLDPNKRYRLLRDPDELRKAAKTFNNIQLLSEHQPVDIDDHKPELVVGSLGTDAEYNHPYLDNSIVIWARKAKDGVDKKTKKELSSGYRYRADMTPGYYEGQPYDGVMRDIVGNHVALVKEGRAGHDVVVGDEALTSTKEKTMTNTPIVLSRKAAVTKGALMVYLSPKLAQGAKIALDEVLKGVSAKNFAESKPKIIAGLKKATAGKLAKDASLDDVKLGHLLNGMEKNDEPEGADADPQSGLPMSPEEMKAQATADADPWTKGKEMLKGKVDGPTMDALDELFKKKPDGADEDGDDDDDEDATGADADPAMKPEDAPVTAKAMDAKLKKIAADTAAAVRAEQKALREAEAFVRPWLGNNNLTIACDSAEAVYRTTLKALGIDAKEIHESALPTIIKMQPKPGDKTKTQSSTMAQDAAATAGFESRFGDVANRITHV